MKHLEITTKRLHRCLIEL